MYAKALPLFLALAATTASAGELMRDDFANPASGWQNKAATTDRDLGFAVYTDSGQYQMTPVHDNAFGFIPAPRQAAGGDVHLESDMFLYAGIGAGAGGLACRFQDHQNFYAFLARGDAVLVIAKIRDGKVTPLAQGKVKSIMAGSVDTRLTVDCKGDVLRLRAKNGGTIEARDAELGGGRSGLVVIGEKMAGTSAVFDNFVLAAP
ncbi:MAG TPA: hypothetical protein VLF18_02210 [Tahibacter sp.]|uniref:hypothetical protein n=1 Tax=Tahibacter sp. TaxID=2056211 RepID=UPI002C9262C9|nr:hypothetical protein [Tahibacter sp.]HSX58990.1 hypothetical protein [Tahibacter sp.]